MRTWKQKFYQSKVWRRLRLEIIRRDEYKCRICGELIIGTPEVHHTIPLTEKNCTNPSISLNPELLITTHHECHDMEHSRFGHEVKETIVNDTLNIDYSRR